jgi:hypothetical protein
MKFTNYLKDIQHVSIYPLISLLLFTAVFAAVAIYVFASDKKKMQDHANIPMK